MKIIILGAGQVGSTAAQQLAREQANDVTVVDTRDDILRELQDRLDISTVSGNAAHPATLLAAGSKGADLLVAVTSSDEVNMIATQVWEYHHPLGIFASATGGTQRQANGSTN